MANAKQSNIGIGKAQAAKIGRDKVTDEVSLEHMIDQGGGHVNAQQLGNVGLSDGTDENPRGQPPLTEQEKRNRAIAQPPSGGEADTRSFKGEGPRPTEPANAEKVDPGEDFDARTSRPSTTGRSDMRESRPNHP